MRTFCNCARADIEIFQEESNSWKQLPGIYKVVVGSSSEDAALAGEFKTD